MRTESIAKVIAGAARAERVDMREWEQQVVANLGQYAPGAAPECPVSLLANERLVVVCRKLRRGEDVGTDDRADAVRAGAYAEKLREYATKEAAKLEVLFGAWRAFAAGEREAERECGQLVDRFLRAVWRLELQGPPELAEGRRLAARVTLGAVGHLMPDMDLAPPEGQRPHRGERR